MKNFLATATTRIIVGVVVLLVGSVPIEGVIYANQDTIFINGQPPSSFRARRDVQVDKDLGLDTIVVSSRCATTRGKQGSCQKVDECYPFLFPVNQTTTATGGPSANVNSELVNILIEVSGICDMPPTLKATNQYIKQVLDAEFLICCPNPMTFSNDVAAPPSPATGQDTSGGGIVIEPLKGKTRTCAKVEVQLIPEEEQDEEYETKNMARNNNATTSEEDRIVGGQEAAVGEFPHMVGLLTRNKQFCGGSLIDSNWVLTAAHCVQHMGSSDIANLRLVFGDHDVNRPDVPIQTRTATRVLYHKHFTMKKLQNDIALIKLSSPVEYTKTVQPVCLHDGEGSIDDLTGDLAGWGQLCEGCQQPGKLRKAKLTIWSHSRCVAAYSGIIGITDGQFCAGGKGMDSCRGDSGGALTINSKNREQVGLVSFGVECGGRPGVFTKISAYRDWIDRNLQRFRN